MVSSCPQAMHAPLPIMLVMQSRRAGPRIPIWVVGGWPYLKSMRRVLRYDGALPSMQDEKGRWQQITRDGLREMKAFIAANRAETTPFDIVIEGDTPGDDRERAEAIVPRGSRPAQRGGLKHAGTCPEMMKG